MWYNMVGGIHGWNAKFEDSSEFNVCAPSMTVYVGSGHIKAFSFPVLRNLEVLFQFFNGVSSKCFHGIC